MDLTGVQQKGGKRGRALHYHTPSGFKNTQTGTVHPGGWRETLSPQDLPLPLTPCGPSRYSH